MIPFSEEMRCLYTTYLLTKLLGDWPVTWRNIKEIK